MCGLPFSGKTTLARKIAEYTQSKLIGFDTLWRENEKDIPKSRDGVKGWKYVRRIAQNKMQELLKNNTSVVYDDINVCYQHREELRNVVRACGARSVVVYVNTSIDEILKRKEVNRSNRKRHDVEPENFQKAIKQLEPPTVDEDVLMYDQKIPLDEWIGKHF